MQKFKLSLCLAFSMVLFAWAGKAMAQTPTPVKIGDFYYTFSGLEASVTKCIKATGAVIIPETVSYGTKNFNVTSITFSERPFNDNITSIEGQSIISITGTRGNAFDRGDTSTYLYSNQSGTAVKKLIFPNLRIIRNCNIPSGYLDLIDMPELEVLDSVGQLFSTPSLTNKDLVLPKLKTIRGYNLFSGLSVESMSFPSLETIVGSGFSNCSNLKELSFPSLVSVSGIRGGGGSLFTALQNLQLLLVPRLKRVEVSGFLSSSYIPEIKFAEGCEIIAPDVFISPFSSSIILRGVKKISTTYFGANSNELKDVYLPDLEECEIEDLCMFSTNLVSFKAPKLKKVVNTSFLSSRNMNLTKVEIPELHEVVNSRFFDGAPINFLKLRGDLKLDAASRMLLNSYPTVVSLTDEGTVNEILATSLGNNIKGGRFIVPEGKAALYAAKWHLPLDKTMVYSPVMLNKQTDGTKYASGSIPKTASETVYDGITYTNTYDLMHGMTKADCEDPEALGINDIGFTPSLSTLNVHAAAPDPLANVTAYAAKSYVDKHRTSPTEAKEGVLTLEDLSLSAGTTTVRGFGTSAATYGKPVGRATGGFLFKGNTSAFTEVYLPYINAAATTATTNYLKPGEGTTVADDASGDRNFYWHPGGSGFDTGFYHSENTLVPDGRAYLCLPNGISSYAFAKINIQFVDSQTTGISTINNPVEAVSQPWYTLSGIRLVGKPTQGGIYIHGGQKVIIR